MPVEGTRRFIIDFAGGDLACLLNIEGKLRRMGDATTRVLHVAEVLAGER